MKKVLLSIISFTVLFSMLIPRINAANAVNSENAALSLDCVSAILMEQSTGRVLYEKEADVPLPPASVTKIMTLLLIMEALENGNFKLDDMVQVSETAASMGGSQIYLELGEQMTVNDMLKSIIIASANDAAVAMAEFVSGSVESFVAKMNSRAAELGMNNTYFVNVTGLDDGIDNHVTSARDIAIMSRELLKHPKVLEYSTIWMDTVRDGQFGLTNTNRLIRFYSGANGLKTGSTSKAKFCISATAMKNGMQLIAVIMASPTRDTRNEAAKKLLDYGFANYTRVHYPAADCGDIRVKGGIEGLVGTGYDAFDYLTEKGGDKGIEQIVTLDENVAAPVKAGQKVGEVKFIKNGDEIGTIDILAKEDVDKISYFGLLFNMMKKYLLI